MTVNLGILQLLAIVAVSLAAGAVVAYAFVTGHVGSPL